MPSVRIKRGTRAQLNAAASASQLRQGEPYLITDEGRIAIGLTDSTYQAYSKEGEGGGGAVKQFNVLLGGAGQSLAGNAWTVLSGNAYAATPLLAETGTWNLSTGTWTATEAGVYQIIFGASAVSASWVIPQIRHNGASTGLPGRFGSGGNQEGFDVRTIRLAIGDTISGQIFVNPSPTTSNGNGKGLSITRIGS